MDRRLPAGRSDRRSRRWKRWVWWLALLILLGAWYRIEWSGAGPAPAPEVEISPPSARPPEPGQVERPGRDPRRLERPETIRPTAPAPRDADAPEAPPAPLKPRS